MEVRKIKPNEMKRTFELFNIAFEFDMDEKTAAQTPLEFYEHEASQRSDCLQKWAAFDDGNMMSFISARPYSVHFDGADFRADGIGAVSTLPQYRRKGGIRGCFERYLSDAYKSDVAFSYLYPFSTAYYRQFGYEICCMTNNYTLSLKSYDYFKVGGYCRLAEKDDNLLSDIQAVYQGYTEKYNMAVNRTAADFTKADNANPAAENQYTYVYYDDGGAPKGYMSFSKQKNENGGFNLVCGSDFMFSDFNGFKGLLNFCKSFSVYYDRVCFGLPADIDITPLIPEWSLYECGVTRAQHGMARAVNVKAVLENAKYIGSGELLIEISDSQIPENNGIFKTVFENGGARSVGKADEGEPPDISMPIGDFSVLILGAADVSSLRFNERVAAYAEPEKLSRVFYKKPCCIWDSF